MSDPITRAARNIQTMAVSVGQLLGMHNGVDLRWIAETRTWHCEKATPVVWFDSVLFGLCTRPEFGPWEFGDTRIRLTADNGTWIWVTTGRRQHEPRGDGTAATFYEARWPD